MPAGAARLASARGAALRCRARLRRCRRHSQGNLRGRRPRGSPYRPVRGAIAGTPFITLRGGWGGEPPRRGTARAAGTSSTETVAISPF